MSYYEFDINTEITYLKGVGPRRAAALNKMNIFTFYDFLVHYPRDYEDEREVTPIDELEENTVAIVVGHIYRIESRTVRNNLTLINAMLRDYTGTVKVTWFNQEYLMSKLEEGMKLVVKGKVSEPFGYYNKYYSITVQAFDILDEDEDPNLGIFPIYPSTANLNQKFFRTSMRILLDRLPTMKEMLPSSILSENDLISYDTAIR